MTLTDFMAKQQLEFDSYLNAQRSDAEIFFAAQKEAGLSFIHLPFTKTKAERRKSFSQFMDAQDQEYKAFASKQKQELEEFYKTQSRELEMFLKSNSQP